jgi:predicted enzyme related to lactoylglutathione lyase
MERVTGIGGLFFPSPDPAALAAWYSEHLGIDEVPTSYDGDAWSQQAGTTVFAPMEASEEFFSGPNGFILNLRVADLDAMVAQLRAAGIAVEVDPEEYPNGVFASLADPDGNPIQLWEPRGPGE